MDWQNFLEDNGIDYVTSGPNTRKGQISIQCPWCGDEDPSEHLSISLIKEAFGCWRNSEHRGRKPHPLVAALLGCSTPQAKLIVTQYSATNPSTLNEALTALTATNEAPKPNESPFEGGELLAAFRPITKQGNAARFWRYLSGRGFDDVAKLVNQYGLLCCHTGRWKDRIIIPLQQDQKLIGWTARAIQNVVTAPRYLSTSSAIKTTILNEDELVGGEILFIVEGPFDALKLDYYGRAAGSRATCTFGINTTVDQIGILRQVVKRFKEAYVLFDKGATEAAFQVADQVGCPMVTLPEGIDDPGSMTKQQVMQLIPVAS